MSPLKTDLICEIIRKSQCNLLEKKGYAKLNGSDECEEQVMNWVRYNARCYREHFRDCLEVHSTAELGDILKSVATSGKHLNEILDKLPVFVERNGEKSPV